MHHAFAIEISRMRREAGIAQEAVAHSLGVSRALLSAWERGEQPVPMQQVEGLALALGLEVQSLRSLWLPPLGRMTRHEQPRQDRFLPPYPINGSVDEMCEKYGSGDLVYCRAKRILTPAEDAVVRHVVPRDSPLELLSTYRLFNAGCKLHAGTPLYYGCRRLVVEIGTHKYAGDLVRPVLVWKHEKFELIAIPQVSMIVVAQSIERRPDFLVRYSENGKQVWIDLEIDGGKDLRNADEDARKAYGLGLPRRGYQTHVVDSDQFVPRVLRDAHWLLHNPPPERRNTLVA